MATFPTFSNLEGLADLACRDTVDIRPTLLRVLTELYVQKPSHTAEEEHHYAELALRLIEAVGPAVRTTIAAKLATYPQAPRAVLMRLASEGDGPCLKAVDFRVMVDRLDPVTTQEGAGPRHHGDFAPVLVEGPGADGASPVIAEGRAGNLDATSDNLPGDPPTATELTELFFGADSAERELILMAAEFVSAELADDRQEMVAPELLRRLEIAALAHQRHIFLRELGLALKLHRPMVERIVDDKLGEPILIAAKAIGMRADMLQRILLFLNPTVGHSVRRVYELSKLYDRIAPEAAAALARILKAADSGGDQPTPGTAQPRPLTQLRPEAARPISAPLQHTERRVNKG